MKATKYIIVLLLGMFAFAKWSIGQISEGGVPFSFSHTLEPTFGSYDLNVTLRNPRPIIRIDTTGGDTDMYSNSPIGEVFSARIDQLTSGSWNTLENGDRIWRLKISTNAGLYMMLVFSDFYLPEGTSLFVYSEDKRQLIGAFTSKTNTKTHKLTTTPLKCNSLVLEYYKPHQVLEQEKLTIRSIGLITEPILKKFGDAEECMINAKCSQYEDWCNQRRSVALIFGVDQATGVIYLSNGTLLTNERRDGKPLLLTALQGIDINPVNDALEQAELDGLQNYLFVFNYQSAGCDNPLEEPSMAYSISGATCVSSDPETDYALLQLNHKPPGNYNVYYNGWSNDKDDMSETGVSIHHPKADIKKISEWEKKTSTNLNRWNVKWVHGSMSDGSFGAPLFNSSGYVVGQRRSYNGYPVCDDKLRDRFGRFDKSWHKYGLSSGLNPNGDHSGSSTFYIVRMAGDESCKSDWYFSSGSDLHTSDNVSFLNTSTIETRQYDGVYNAQNSIVAENVTIQPATSVTFEAGQRIILSPGFKAKTNSVFLAKIANCERGCGNGFKKTASDYSNNMDIAQSSEQTNESLSQQHKSSLDETIIVYPNTSVGLFTIELQNDNDQPISDIKVYDLQGRLIKTIPINKTKITIDISNQPVGPYLLHIRSGNKTYVKRVIVTA